MEIEQKIFGIVEGKIADTDLFIVDIHKAAANKLLILIDGDQGVSIEQCATISRHVGHIIEEEEWIDYAYTLEVSSPGLDAPLRLMRQYQKNIGRSLDIKMKDGVKRTGTLLEAGDDFLKIEETVKDPNSKRSKKTIKVEAEIALDQINEAKVMVSFKK